MRRRSLSSEELVKYGHMEIKLLSEIKKIVDSLDLQIKSDNNHSEIPGMIRETQSLLNELNKLSIGVGYLSGLKQKELAEIYRLSTARICQIIKELRERGEKNVIG